MSVKKSARSTSSTVPVKDVFKVGIGCAVAAFIISIIVTRAWIDHSAFVHSFIYAGVAFVVVTILAFILNAVMAGDTQNEDQSFPRMK